MDTEQVCHTKSVQVVENNGKQRDGEALMTKIMIAGCGRQPHTPVVGESGTALRLSLALRKPLIFAAPRQSQIAERLEEIDLLPREQHRGAGAPLAAPAPRSKSLSQMAARRMPREQGVFERGAYETCAAGCRAAAAIVAQSEYRPA